MLRLSRRVALLPAVLVLLAAAGRVDAQTVVVTSPAPVVTTYYAPPPATVVVPSPVTVATYRYGLLPRRQVTVSTYYTPAPVVAPAPAVVVTRPVRAVRYYYGPVYYYP